MLLIDKNNLFIYGIKVVVFFDLETTGINIGNDRIVEISMLKIFPNGNKESNTWLVNPEIEIPAETSAIHGITNERVVTEPTFKELAQTVYNLIDDADLAGFNSPLIIVFFIMRLVERLIAHHKKAPPPLQLVG